MTEEEARNELHVQFNLGFEYGIARLRTLNKADPDLVFRLFRRATPEVYKPCLHSAGCYRMKGCHCENCKSYYPESTQ